MGTYDLCECGKQKRITSKRCFKCSNIAKLKPTTKIPGRYCIDCNARYYRKGEDQQRCWNCSRNQPRADKVDKPKTSLDYALAEFRSTFRKVTREVPIKQPSGATITLRKTYYRCPGCGAPCTRARCLECELRIVSRVSIQFKQGAG